MEVHSAKVVGGGDDTSTTTGHNYPFQEQFWSQKVDIILNAFNNVDARLYMDTQFNGHAICLMVCL